MVRIREAGASRQTPQTREESRERVQGLSAQEVERSRATSGVNRLTQRRRRSFIACFLGNLKDPVIRVLLTALLLNAALSIRGGDWLETLGIAVSVVLATLISTLSERGSEKAFLQLQAREQKARCRVLRREGMVELPWDALVVGDTVSLQAGEGVPADGVLLRGALWVDESALTGESRSVEKQAGSQESRLLRGSTVLRGEGLLRITEVGDRTMLGGISQEVQSEVGESPLRARLTVLARQISRIGYAAAVLVAAAYLFHTFFADSGFDVRVMMLKLGDWRYLVGALLHALTLGLTVVVVAVPEGLPMMIAVVLSANMRRMIRDRVLVRKGAGIEAAGSMDLLFTDKTGTLTEGRPGVGEILLCDGTLADVGQATSDARAALLAISFRENGGASVSADGKALGGNATDRALLAAAAELPPGGRVERLQACPFESERKFSAVAVRLPDGREVTLIKGAPEKLLPRIRLAYAKGARVVPFAREEVSARIRARTARGERMLAMAILPAALSLAQMERGAFDGAVFLCAVQLCDRLRPGAPRAVARLQGAGVQVVMITGDAPETAAHIARECGILRREEQIVTTGEALAALSDYEVRTLLPRLAVVARARPGDKSRLVRLAQESNRVVGMTGDGVNDAPALRRCDVGFAMGSGSDVAKEAGDVIILDDDLASIVNAVVYGRNVFKSIRKFITLQLTMNFCAVGVCMIGPFIGVDAPVTVVQMLWINLIMDTLGGLAFAGEAASPSLLQEAPKKRDTPILCRYMVDQIALLGGYTVGLCVAFLKHPWVRAQFCGRAGDLSHLTAFFALFIFASVFNCFNARSDRRSPLAGLTKNRAFIGIMALILGVQIAFVYLGGSVLRTVPLTARELALTAAFALSVVPAELARKQLWRLRGHRDRF